MLNDSRAILWLNLAALLWAGNMLLGHFLGSYVGPWFIVAARTLVGSLIFWGFMRLRGITGLVAKIRSWPLVVAASLSGVIGFQVLLYLGLRHTSSINAGLINALTPLTTACLSALFLREALNRHQSTAAAITVLGVGWILTRGELSTLYQLSFNGGDLLVLAAVLAWSLYGIFGQHLMRDLGVLEATAIGLYVAPLFAVPAALWEGTQQITPQLNGAVVLALAFICIGPTVLALLWWNRGVQLIGPTRAALYTNMIPVYVIVLSAAILDDVITRAHLIGGTLVLGGSLYGGLHAALASQRAVN
ncbi:MAG: DMT family transporter [Porticoccaceae bacterium]